MSTSNYVILHEKIQFCLKLGCENLEAETISFFTSRKNIF